LLDHFSSLWSPLGRLLCTAIAAGGTVSCAISVDDIVAAHDLQRSLHTGTAYSHLVLHNNGSEDDRRLHVYIEGDGTPWIQGRTPSTDPTPTNPIALKLMVLDSSRSAYIGRPCYFGTATEDSCTSDDWTFGRYSTDVIDSMATVIEAVRSSLGQRDVVIFGHSGGGAIARLLATKVSGVVAIVTIAANLDTAAWTEVHGYLPLTTSLNPAELDPLPATIVHLQLIGEDDKVVPLGVTESYRRAGHQIGVWSFESFDHRCCWQSVWPTILARVDEALLSTSTAHFDDRKY
jgi:pimeloyl-ACP methyl ester carboxylesterase